jgi:hypothetical protein
MGLLSLLALAAGAATPVLPSWAPREFTDLKRYEVVASSDSATVEKDWKKKEFRLQNFTVRRLKDSLHFHVVAIYSPKPLDGVVSISGMADKITKGPVGDHTEVWDAPGFYAIAGRTLPYGVRVSFLEPRTNLNGKWALVRRDRSADKQLALEAAKESLSALPKAQ